MFVSNWCVLQGAQAARRRATAETCARRSGEAPVEAGRCEDDECYHGDKGDPGYVHGCVCVCVSASGGAAVAASVNERLS